MMAVTNKKSKQSFSAAKTTKNKAPAITHGASDDSARLITDENGIVLFATPSFVALCGYDSDISGEAFEVLFDGMSPDEINEGAQNLQIVTIAPTNKKLALQFDWIDMPAGQRYLIASAEEVTARAKLKDFIAEKIKVKKEQKKTNPSNQYDTHPFIDMSHDACLITNDEGEGIYANAAFYKIIGVKRDQISTLSFLDIIHEEDRPFVHRALQDLRQSFEETNYYAGNAAYDFDAKTISKSGKVHWVQWQIKGENNQLFFLGRDITAIKQQKELLKKQRKDLQEAEAIAHMGHWRWPVGADNLILSTEIYNIFGIEKDSFVPTLDNVNAMIFRDDAGRMTQVFQRAIIEQNDYDIDFRLTRPDGEVRYIRCEGRCDIDEEDDVQALYGIMHDVTETVLREKDLMQAKENAERAYNAKSQFLANMSHELRTPLNAIIGFSEMMQHQLLGPIGNERYVEYISGIRESGEHLLDLISDILDMSKIEAGKYELHLEKFNLAKTIKLALHMIESRALDSNLKLICDIENEGLEIVADRRAVMQMILNLLSNAVKFSKQNGQIILSCCDFTKGISIKVTDEGIGIPANKLANITQPFEQVGCSYTREHEGSGLGLAITKELAQAHGGSLKIESTLDVGTIVTIHLPHKAIVQ